MYAFDSSQMADALWILALLSMALRSAEAWRRMPEDAWAPMLWSTGGEPVLWTGRDLAVSFTPMAAMAGGLLLAAADRLSGGDQAGLILARDLAPALLAAAHAGHMGAAVKAVRA